MNKSSQEIATVDTEASRGAQQKKKFTLTQRITHLATLVAMALVFKLLGNVLTFGSFKITIVYIPWIISALVMGPLGGMAVCFATDLIGTFIVPTGGLPIPLIVFSNTLFGLIMGLSYMIPKLSLKLKTFIGTAAVIVVCTLGLSTLALSQLYVIPFWTMCLSRVSQAVMVALNAAVVAFLFPLLKKMKMIR